MVVEGGDDAGPSEPIESQAAVSPLSYSSDDSEEESQENEDDEEVDITGDMDAAGEEEEKGCEGEINPKGAHPDPYLFSLHFAIFNILIIAR